MKKYDAVVVGAGTSGLAAAIRLQLAGKKTLLIEQHNLPGGCATSFRRGRFEFEPSLHELCDIGSEAAPGEVRELLAEYGVKVEWRECPDCYRMISKYSDGEKMDVTMPHGIDAFIDKMEEYVPGSRSKMVDLFDLYEEIRQGTMYSSANAGHADSSVMKERFPNMLRTGAYPVNKVFAAMKLPQRVRDIMSVYWSYLGVDMDHLPFIHYASMMQRYERLGAYTPTYTSHELSTAMVERFRELGGETMFNCRAEKFVFKGDRLCGVETTSGLIECDMALPDINPDIVYGRMIPRELVPEREKKLSTARAQRYGARMFTVYFGLDCDYRELGIENYSYFLVGTADSAQEYRDIMGGYKTDNYCIFLCYNVMNPEASPEGTCICSITTLASPVDWNDLSQRDYVAFKQKMAKKMIDIVKTKTGIELEGHIEEISIATPWTFARYLGVPEGSVYGHEARDWDGMMARMMMLSKDYPVKGLRPIGAGGPRSDGYSATMLTGNTVAKLAIKDLNAMKEGGES
ncbi:MAG: NAD(P)/FAD-dependent oxidoreductase [Lachnospiraceae bacterium]|nr:NAD(P)/FAD-dependent oxidoreductase [Lachnospiraceae bacterium]